MRFFFVISFFLLFGKLLADCSWLDLPEALIEEIFSISTPEVEAVSMMAREYHELPKNLKEFLPERIQKLEEIEKYLTDHMLGASRSTQELLLLQIQGKRSYLQALLEFPTDEEIDKYHLDFSAVCDQRYTPIPLRNNGNYSLKMKEFWGNFWLESIDPCHRRLADYYRFWQNKSPQNSDYLSFFLWLETEPIPKYVPIVRYLTQKECAEREVVVQDGYLMQKRKFFTTFPQNKNLFIIDLQKRMYVESWGDGIWHTSLSSGRPVLGAGLLHVEGGVIHRICFESGHYLPTLSQSYQAIKILKEKAVCFASTVEIIYFESRNKYKACISPEVLGNEEQFFKEILDVSKRELVSSSEF